MITGKILHILRPAICTINDTDFRKYKSIGWSKNLHWRIWRVNIVMLVMARIFVARNIFRTNVNLRTRS